MSLYITKNFKFSEYTCGCGCGKINPIDPKLIYLLQNLRDKIGKPIYITSGLRCKKFNKKIKGYINSPHCLGKAVDIHVKNMNIIDLAIVAKEIGFLRIGLYPYNHFIHVDTVNPYRGSASWVRFLAGNYVYFKTLEEAIKRIGGK